MPLNPLPPFSVLDLVPIPEGGTAASALADAAALARHVEALGFHRLWVAEHHNMPGIASAATAVVIGHLAAATSTIRIGSGGIMLPNHSPLAIAEQFGTLAALFPGRIDLGLGRAPGGDGTVFRALRRTPEAADRFPRDVQELQFLLEPSAPGQPLIANPGAGSAVPLYLLGSSTFSAELAGLLGLPFAFAAHFAPDALGAALALYRSSFRPSAALTSPHAIVCVTAVAADTDEEARFLFTSQQQAFVNLRRGTPSLLPRPVSMLDANERERANVDHALRYAVVGAPGTVETGLRTLLDETHADEIMITTMVHEQAARRRSYALVAEIRDRLGASAKRVAA